MEGSGNFNHSPVILSHQPHPPTCHSSLTGCPLRTCPWARLSCLRKELTSSVGQPLPLDSKKCSQWTQLFSVRHGPDLSQGSPQSVQGVSLYNSEQPCDHLGERISILQPRLHLRESLAPSDSAEQLSWNICVCSSPPKYLLCLWL